MQKFYETQVMLHMIGQKFERCLQAKDGSISLHQFHFLNYIERSNSCTPSEIAKHFGVTLGAVTGFVDRLFKQNLITRERSEEDRRLVVIQLSEEGRKQLNLLNERMLDVYHKMEEQLGEDEIEVFNRHLARILRVLTELEDNVT
ncbi:MarR family transcriptional regulator [Desulfitobacterium sp.]|uniref:MarR family winged helix-turn-helix transcriptional regulator n=1 Tax=Desulfitobacterium sp. TaxID=49981 RepID=UPI002B1E9A57|nr:MarR family transcriptional regulator [Desulfitobacterium sp.]MEA4902002.1 MarR family transcriptional regulator [Desulfitobacterium sp.]